MPPPGDNTIYVVDDDASVRDSLSLMLSLKGFSTATFASAEDFLAVAQPDWRGCVLADLRMGGMSGLEMLEQMRGRFPHLAAVVLTAHGNVAAARRAFLADAADFLEKPFDPEQLLAAIGTARSRLHRPQPPAAAKPRLPGEVLTPREREVLDLVLQGLHNRQIAQRLGISARTVEVHKGRVMEKLGASSVVELVRLVDANSR